MTYVCLVLSLWFAAPEAEIRALLRAPRVEMVAPAVQGAPFVKMPEKLEVDQGRLGRIRIDTNGKQVKWIVPPELDCFREYDPDPTAIRLVVQGWTNGSYRLYAYTALGDVPSEPAVCVVTVGKGPAPVPPGPNPPIPPDPKPPTPQGIKVLVVYETSTPGDVAKIVGPVKVRDYLNQKCVKDGSNPEWRVLDKDVDMQYMSQFWKDAMVRPRQSIPWIQIHGANQVLHEGPLPANADALLQLLTKFGG